MCTAQFYNRKCVASFYCSLDINKLIITWKQTCAAMENGCAQISMASRFWILYGINPF